MWFYEVPKGCKRSRPYCATGHEAVFVIANSKTLPVGHYLIQAPKLECQHTSMQHSMLNHTPLPLPLPHFGCRLLLFSYQEDGK